MNAGNVINAILIAKKKKTSLQLLKVVENILLIMRVSITKNIVIVFFLQSRPSFLNS